MQVVRCYQLGLRRLSERLAPLEVTTAQLDVLANLVAGPDEGLTQDELGQRLLVTKGNVSGLLDRLGQRGWVVRRTHPEDRRSNLVFLSQAGRELAERAVAVQNEFVAELLGPRCGYSEMNRRATSKKFVAPPDLSAQRKFATGWNRCRPPPAGNESSNLFENGCTQIESSRTRPT